MELRRLQVEDEAQFFKAVEAFPNELHFKFIPSFDISGMSFQQIFDKLNDYESGRNLPPGFVADTLLFAFNEQGEIVGRCSVRHEINEYLKKYAGHLGYGVVPVHRKKGYASKILKKSLVFIKNELGLSKILITCDDDNIGSIKTIENNGFKDFEHYNDDTLRVPKRHYWVNI